MRKVRLNGQRKIGKPVTVKGRVAIAAKGNPYNYRWQKERRVFLREHPFCVHCLEEKGLYVASTVVDHIIPHQGDQRLFWDKETNWQALCAECHNSWKAKQESAMGFRAR